MSRKKISLVAWKIICKSKSHYDLGILDLKIVNYALLVKWFVTFYDPQVQGKWKELFLAKYDFKKFSNRFSHFW